MKIVAAQSLPENVRTWTVTDVSRWLDAMSLGQYCEGFVEASVDGPFLLEVIFIVCVDMTFELNH